MSEKSKNLYCCGGGSATCEKPATWIRHTQFSGDHPFCIEHARKEENFKDKKGDSYFFWEKIPENQVAPPKPPQVKLADVIAKVEARAQQYETKGNQEPNPLDKAQRRIERLLASEFRKLAATLKEVNAL